MASVEAVHVLHPLMMSADEKPALSESVLVIDQDLSPAYQGQQAKHLRLYLDGDIEVLDKS